MQLTRITSKEPNRLSKGFTLDKNGELVKLPGGAMVSGKAERLTLTAAQIPTLIQSLKPDQALCYGVPSYPKAIVLTQKALKHVKQNGGPPIIARDRDHFSWPIGAGIGMFDYDPRKGQEPMTMGRF